MNDKNGNAIRMGDVVRVEGAASKAQNGLFMVTHDSAGGFSLARVKKTGEICIQNAANYQVFPPHSYMSDPRKRRAANEQNARATVELDAVENTAHMARYWREKADSYTERAENLTRNGYDNDDAKQCRYLAAQAAEIAERLEQAAQPVAEKYIPPLTFTADGLKINGGRVAPAHYGITRDDDGTPNAVTIYARDYGADFPREWLDVRNDTDSMTDYFDTDHATITPEHPLFPFALFAALAQAAKDAKRRMTHRAKMKAAGRSVWSVTTDEQDARSIAAYEEAKNPGKPTPETFEAITAQREQAKREQEAREEAERAAEAAKVERERTDGRAFIEQTVAEYPITERAPYVRVCWSEHPAFYDYDDDTLTLSIAAADIILRTFDEQRAEQKTHGRGGYDKTKFRVISPRFEDGEYVGRYDLGDGEGGLIGYYRNRGMNDTADYLEEYTPAGRVVSVEAAPWIDELAAARKKKAEQDAARTAANVEMLTDDQLVAAVKLSPPYADAERRNIARAFLQELCSRDRERAYDVFTAWKDGTLNKKEG